MLCSYEALFGHGESYAALRYAHFDAPDRVICFQLAYHTAVFLVYRRFLGDAEGNKMRNRAIQGATTAAIAIRCILCEYQRRCQLTRFYWR